MTSWANTILAKDFHSHLLTTLNVPCAPPIKTARGPYLALLNLFLPVLFSMLSTSKLISRDLFRGSSAQTRAQHVLNTPRGSLGSPWEPGGINFRGLIKTANCPIIIYLIGLISGGAGYVCMCVGMYTHKS